MAYSHTGHYHLAPNRSVDVLPEDTRNLRVSRERFADAFARTVEQIQNRHREPVSTDDLRKRVEALQAELERAQLEAEVRRLEAEIKRLRMGSWFKSG